MIDEKDKIEEARSFLYLLKNEPTLLPIVEDLTYREAIHRAFEERRDEDHYCFKCGDEANECFIIEPPGAIPRWLDLCYECSYWIRKVDSQ